MNAPSPGFLTVDTDRSTDRLQRHSELPQIRHVGTQALVNERLLREDGELVRDLGGGSLQSCRRASHHGEPAVVAFFPGWGKKKVLARFLKLG